MLSESRLLPSSFAAALLLLVLSPFGLAACSGSDGSDEEPSETRSQPEHCHPVELTLPDGTTASYEYDGGSVATVEGKHAFWGFSYNDDGRITRVVFNQGEVVEVEYSEMGRKAKFSSGEELFYDENGRLESIGDFFMFEYDEEGHLAKITADGRMPVVVENSKLASGEVFPSRFEYGDNVYTFDYACSDTERNFPPAWWFVIAE